jgi:hypothetical protein
MILNQEGTHLRCILTYSIFKPQLKAHTKSAYPIELEEVDGDPLQRLFASWWGVKTVAEVARGLTASATPHPR